jgi:hypothetical protein
MDPLAQIVDTYLFHAMASPWGTWLLHLTMIATLSLIASVLVQRRSATTAHRLLTLGVIAALVSPALFVATQDISVRLPILSVASRGVGTEQPGEDAAEESAEVVSIDGVNELHSDAREAFAHLSQQSEGVSRDAGELASAPAMPVPELDATLGDSPSESASEWRRGVSQPTRPLRLLVSSARMGYDNSVSSRS